MDKGEGYVESGKKKKWNLFPIWENQEVIRKLKSQGEKQNKTKKQV